VNVSTYCSTPSRKSKIQPKYPTSFLCSVLKQSTSHHLQFPTLQLTSNLTFIIRTSRRSLETFGAIYHFIFSLPAIIKIASDTTALLLFVQPLIQQWIPWSHSPGAKWPERETYHSPSSSRNILHSTSSSSSCSSFFFFFSSLVPP